MPPRCRQFFGSLAATILGACQASAQVEPLRLYTPKGQPVGVAICDAPEAEIPSELWLIDPSTGEVESGASIIGERADLGALFPQIWTDRPAKVRAVQPARDGAPIGRAVIVEPLTTVRRASDGLTSAIAGAVEKGDRAVLLRLLGEAESSRRTLRQSVKLAASNPATEEVQAVRTYLDERVLLETSEGTIELALRPDAAPRTCFHFLQLVKGGFYDGTIFHRIVAADGKGRPFLIQGGDPLGTGAGGPGFAIDFEPSSLLHDFGVVSMARQPNDPNSGGSQFFISLSREACASLDGHYTSFARVARGADVLSRLAATPVGPVRTEAGPLPGDRPLEPPVIRAARAVPAPPMGFGQAPAPHVSLELNPVPVER